MWVCVVLGLCVLNNLPASSLPISNIPTDGDKQHLGSYGNIADWHLKDLNSTVDNWLKRKDNYTGPDPRAEESDNSLIANTENEFNPNEGENVPNIHARNVFHPSSIVDFAKNSGPVRFPMNPPAPAISHQEMTQLSVPEQMGSQEVEVGHPQVDTHRHVTPDFDHQMGHQVHPNMLPLFGIHNGPAGAPIVPYKGHQGVPIGPPMPPSCPGDPLGLQNRDIGSQGSQEVGPPMDCQDSPDGESCCKSMVHHGAGVIGPQVPQLGPHGPQMGPLGHAVGPNMGFQGLSVNGHPISHIPGISQVQNQIQPQMGVQGSNYGNPGPQVNQVGGQTGMSMGQLGGHINTPQVPLV